MSGFRVVGEEEVARGTRISLGRRRIVGPDGAVHERDVVHHPGAVGVVPVHDDGSVTLVRQYRAALDALVLEIPAGLRDVDGEAEAETARRELAEEVGLAAGRIEPLLVFHNSPGFCDEVVALFLATDLRAVPEDRQGAEEAEMTVERMALADAMAAIHAGGLTDAKTVIALLAVSARSHGG